MASSIGPKRSDLSYFSIILPIFVTIKYQQRKLLTYIGFLPNELLKLKNHLFVLFNLFIIFLISHKSQINKNYFNCKNLERNLIESNFSNKCQVVYKFLDSKKIIFLFVITSCCLAKTFC